MYWKESAELVAVGLWPGTCQSLELSGPRFRWFHVYISESENWDLVSQGAKVAWLGDTESW